MPVEDQFEGAGEIQPLLFWIPIRQKEIEQVTELDRLRMALVGHGFSLLQAALRHDVGW